MKRIESRSRIQMMIIKATKRKNISLKKLLEDNRNVPVPYVRQAIMFCLVEIVGLSQSQAGAMLLRKQETVKYGLNRIADEQFVYSKTGNKGKRLQIIDDIRYIFIDKKPIHSLCSDCKYRLAFVTKID